LALHSGREADHSPPSGAEVKEWVELYLHSPIRLHGVVLSSGEHRDNFTFLYKRQINTMLFADDQVITTDNGDDLQRHTQGTLTSSTM
jgi:hypothetical protein